MMRWIQRFVGEQGYSLIEALAAVGLLAVGTLAVVPMQRAAITGNRTTFSEQVAVSLASQLLEQARDLAFKDTRLAATDAYVAPASTLSPASPLTDTGQTGGRFDRTWRIRNDQPLANVKEISVRVGWIETGKRREVTVTTLRTR
ncbi:MAG: hypothetical protein QOD06_227 [Candidatus Binatota bacterium]|jgi:Tfp pilus assembly protein PilV|nr:hypothetical protein [Candidatus Binatota bacterium]